MVGISTVLLLAGGTFFTTMSLKTANAQASTLGEPILVEKGKITSQSQLGPNRTQFTFSTNGTLNGSIEVTNTGSYVSTSIGNNFAINEGQGVISTKDGNETASYSLIGTDNVTQDGKVTFRGSVAYSTNSTANLSVLNNMVGFFKGEGDIRTGNEIDAIVHNLFFQGGEVKILNIKSHLIILRYYTVISTLMSISRSCRAQAYE